VACAKCGEGINYDRFMERNGETLCLACACPEQRYYQPAGAAAETEQTDPASRCECA
jgi:hypothetical protein